jgi:hypothetical protein
MPSAELHVKNKITAPEKHILGEVLSQKCPVNIKLVIIKRQGKVLVTDLC